MRPQWLLAVALAFALGGCARLASNQAASEPAPASAEPAAPAADQSRPVVSSDGFKGEIIGYPAPGSKFSRVAIGMPIREVEDRIGSPSDTAAHITGKAFIPFYFGGDTSMTELFYKGEGQLSFTPANFGSSDLRLERIIVNRNEIGYAH